MKKIFLFLIILTCQTHCFSQSRAFSYYNGDTLSYLQENFINNKNYYIGKPFSVLLSNLQLEVKSYFRDDYNFELYSGITLSFITRSESYGNEDNIRSYYLIIELDKPEPKDSIDKMNTPYSDNNWTLKSKTYFSKKNIKNIKLFYTCECKKIKGIIKCEVCDPSSLLYNAAKCAYTFCDPESANYDSIRCEKSICDKNSPLYDEKLCNYSKALPGTPNYVDTISYRLLCDSIVTDILMVDGQIVCDSCYCNPASSMYNPVKCKRRRSLTSCDPSLPFYNPVTCVTSSVGLLFDFSDLIDYSFNKNAPVLQDGAYLEMGNLMLSGGNPGDYLLPHATVSNSSSLNPQYITVAARIKPEEFVGCGNDVIVSKPFTSHTAPYYQYHLGICGTYCGGGGHYFSLACSINGRSEGMYSPANAWIPGQWSTVVGTYDGSAMKLYVNGSLVASKTVSGSLDSYPTDLFIGKQGNIDYSIPAEIDWVKTYNRALSETEVQALSGQ